MIALVADVGGTRIKLAVMRERALLAHQGLDARSREGLAPQLPRIVECFELLCRRCGVARTQCDALAMAFPSLIDAESGRVRTAYGKYQDAPSLDLAGWARDALGLPLVMENDARAALLGEWQAGAGRGSDDLVMVTLGTGLGTAALVAGRLLRGKHGQAGVLGGHFTVRRNGRRCTCGNTGCAEAEASTHALPAIAGAHADFPHSALRLGEITDYAAVMRLAGEQDACALDLKSQAIEVWTDMIINLIHAYDPERVIVGGGIVTGGSGFLAELERCVLSRAHTPGGRVEFHAAQLGDAAALYGGAYLAAERLRHLQ